MNVDNESVKDPVLEELEHRPETPVVVESVPEVVVEEPFLEDEVVTETVEDRVDVETIEEPVSDTSIVNNLINGGWIQRYGS
jgi:hypothetical protein